jgi:hypothetical protein
MSSRDVWSRGGREPLRDLLCGALASLLLLPSDERPAYFSSPWMSDFPLFDSPFRQFAGLFPEEADEPKVWFTGYLEALARRRPVRIITVRDHPVSIRFAAHPRLRRRESLDVRFAPAEYHEKGMLTPTFYIEGSMNITYSGVNVRDEKVVFHVPDDSPGTEKIARAYLEFDRFWGGLA